jgi:hypothetical protein
MSTAILIPAMRPRMLAPLAENIREATPEPHTVYFIATGDCAEAVNAIPDVHPIYDRGGTWAERINRGVEATTEPSLFLGAEDVLFHPGWLTAALAIRSFVTVVNDLHNPAGTMALVRRGYVEFGTVDGPELLHDGYAHNFVDTEFFETARSRGALAYCEDSIVEHLHPAAGKALDDAVYRLGRRRLEDDRRLYEQRRPLWAPR